MLTGVKLRCYPTPEQATSLRLWIGHQRFIYNAKVQEQDYWYRFSKASLALTGLKPLPDQMYSQFHDAELTPWLSQVPSQILRNGTYRFAQANARFMKGLSGAPNIKKKCGRQSVMVSSELFEYRERACPQPKSDGPAHFDLFLGTKKHTLGAIKVKAHVYCTKPKSLTISLEPSGRWYVSFCCELPALQYREPSVAAPIIRSQDELVYEFSLRNDLDAITVGIDRGVAIPVALSNDACFDIPPVCRKRITKKERFIRRFQRRMAKQIKGSCNYRKNQIKVAKLKGYGADVRKDFAHKTSHYLVDSQAHIFVFEDLKVRNLTAAPKAKVDGEGRYIANGAAAKAGLNKAMLSSALGLVKQFTTYKAANKQKLVLSVPAHHTSQECSACGLIGSDNRLAQSVFRCTACSHTENADLNASKVIRRRGIKLLAKHRDAMVAGAGKAKVKKSVRVRGAKKVEDQTVGQVMPDPAAGILLPTLVARHGDLLGQSTSDAANDPFVQSAMLEETRNPHLASKVSGG